MKDTKVNAKLLECISELSAAFLGKNNRDGADKIASAAGTLNELVDVLEQKGWLEPEP